MDFMQSPTWIVSTEKIVFLQETCSVNFPIFSRIVGGSTPLVAELPWTTIIALINV